jgi:hypothetical protein
MRVVMGVVVVVVVVAAAAVVRSINLELKYHHYLPNPIPPSFSKSGNISADYNSENQP